MSKTVRWGILGTGRIARDFATALRATPGASIAAVASREHATAAAFANDFDIPLALGSYDGLAACPDVDLVYIGTPHALHADNALAMLAGGKGVLCEKPFALNRAQADTVVAAARSRNLFLMEAMWTRYMPAMAEVRRILASGILGEVTQASADFGFVASGGPEARLFNPLLGGGALLDVGIYPLSITAFLLGDVEQVRAQAEMGPTGVDLQTVFTLRHAGGALSTCACSLKARTPGLLTLSGANGQLRLEAARRQVQRIGSTVVLLVAGERCCGYLWAGDSRIYLCRHGRLHQLTRDHSHVEELKARGQLTAEEALHHPAQHLITRAVGAMDTLDLDQDTVDLDDGDTFLLCSDGLSNEVTEQEILTELAPGDCQQAAQRLVDLALSRGGRDNISAVVVHAEDLGCADKTQVNPTL